MFRQKLRAQEDRVRGNWNEAAINWIVENLLENAIKFTPEGGEVEVRLKSEDGRAILEVEDTGIGMDPEKTEELFEAFRQESEGLDREYAGSGLGLPIVRRHTTEFGGSIRVDTEKGSGTRLTLRLPLEKGSRRASEAEVVPL